MIEAVVIGASAGAIEALSVLLPSIADANCLPIIIVVHIPPDRSSALVELFQPRCRAAVKEVEDKEPILKGTIYFAPPDYHVLVERDRSLSLSVEERVLFSRPSIDVLFESAADAYGSAVVGVILTGASSDGANGLRSILDSGGAALVQDPSEAAAYAMPRAAIELCPEAKVLPLLGITEELQVVSRGAVS